MCAVHTITKLIIVYCVKEYLKEKTFLFLQIMCDHQGDRPYSQSNRVKVCPGECNPRNKSKKESCHETENSWKSKCGEASSSKISCLASNRSRLANLCLDCPLKRKTFDCQADECPKRRKCAKQISKQTLYMLIFLFYVLIQGIAAYFFWDEYWYQMFGSTQVCGIVVLTWLQVTGTVPLP